MTQFANSLSLSLTFKIFCIPQKEKKLNHFFSWYKSEVSRLSLFSSQMRQILEVFICTFLLNLSNGDTKYSLKVQFCFITRWSGGSTVVNTTTLGSDLVSGIWHLFTGPAACRDTTLVADVA